MPRFFFDLQDGHLIADDTGLDMSDDESAQNHAIELAEAVLHKRSENGHTHPWCVIIKDAKGDLLGTVTSIQV